MPAVLVNAWPTATQNCRFFPTGGQNYRQYSLRRPR